MKVKISYKDGKGTVERTWLLREDTLLAGDIMQMVESRGTERDAEPEGELPKGVQGAPAEKRLYRGFVVMRCGTCGRISESCLKQPTDEFFCKECKSTTRMTDMVRAEFRCTSCGKSWGYMTNVEDNGVLSHCINCGAEMQAWWNKKTRKYESVR